MYVISYTSNNIKLKVILTSHSLLNYRDKKQVRSKGIEHDSMDNDQLIKQAMEASGILRDITSNKIAVLLGLTSFWFELKKSILFLIFLGTSD